VKTTRPIPVYWLVVGMATMVLSPLLSIFASVTIAENNAEHTRQQQEQAQAQAQVESRKVVCGWIAAYLDTFDETPPTSAAGRNLRARFVELYQISQCQPPRK
jgi:hypothetical protein